MCRKSGNTVRYTHIRAQTTHNSYIISGRRGGCSSSRLYTRRVVHNERAGSRARVLSQQVCHTSRASSLSNPKNQCRPPRPPPPPPLVHTGHGILPYAYAPHIDRRTSTTTATSKPVFDLYNGQRRRRRSRRRQWRRLWWERLRRWRRASACVCQAPPLPRPSPVAPCHQQITRLVCSLRYRTRPS